jgi:hypothetical protein
VGELAHVQLLQIGTTIGKALEKLREYYSGTTTGSIKGCIRYRCCSPTSVFMNQLISVVKDARESEAQIGPRISIGHGKYIDFIQVLLVG